MVTGNDQPSKPADQPDESSNAGQADLHEYQIGKLPKNATGASGDTSGILPDIALGGSSDFPSIKELARMSPKELEGMLKNHAEQIKLAEEKVALVYGKIMGHSSVAPHPKRVHVS